MCDDREIIVKLLEIHYWKNYSRQLARIFLLNPFAHFRGKRGGGGQGNIPFRFDNIQRDINWKRGT